MRGRRLLLIALAIITSTIHHGLAWLCSQIVGDVILVVDLCFAKLLCLRRARSLLMLLLKFLKLAASSAIGL